MIVAIAMGSLDMSYNHGKKIDPEYSKIVKKVTKIVTINVTYIYIIYTVLRYEIGVHVYTPHVVMYILYIESSLIVFVR